MSIFFSSRLILSFTQITQVFPANDRQLYFVLRNFCFDSFIYDYVDNHFYKQLFEFYYNYYFLELLNG